MQFEALISDKALKVGLTKRVDIKGCIHTSLYAAATFTRCGSTGVRKVRILVERGGSAKHGATRRLIKHACAKLGM